MNTVGTDSQHWPVTDGSEEDGIPGEDPRHELVEAPGPGGGGLLQQQQQRQQHQHHACQGGNKGDHQGPGTVPVVGSLWTVPGRRGEGVLSFCALLI